MSDDERSEPETTETNNVVEPEAEIKETFEIISVKHGTLSNLNKQRLDNDDMCDVILQVEDADFPAHRLVLSASSDYFLKMFTIDMQEKRSKKVTIKSVTVTAMSEILNSVYINKISFSKLNISDILHGASLMQFPAIVLAAARYIEQNIGIGNCYWFRKLVLAHPFESLKETVIDFFLICIEEASTYSEFLDFTFDELNKIFGSDDLHVEKEKNVFEMLVKWLKNDEENRKEDFAVLFKHVRLQFVPIEYIIDVIRNNEIVMQFDKSRCSVENALVYHIKPSVLPKQVLRKCFVADSVMFVSYANKNENVQGFYDLKNSSWRMKPMKFMLTDSCCVASKHPVSVFCGVGESNKEVIQFNGYQWMELPSMNEARFGAAAVFFNEKLFVFGGEKQPIPFVWPLQSSFTLSSGSSRASFRSRSNSAFSTESFCCRFEMFSDSWKTHKQNCSQYSRSYFSAQAFGNKIFFIGGYKFDSQYNKEVCNETLSFCPSTNKWKIVSGLLVARASFGCAVLHSKIYAFGGIGVKQSHVGSVEIFDVYQKCWTSGGSIESDPMSACVVSNRIYFWNMLSEHLWLYKNSRYISKFCCNEIIEAVSGAGVLLPFSYQCLRLCFCEKS